MAVILRYFTAEFNTFGAKLRNRAAVYLSMFSMFGRTARGPTKMGPTRGAANFLHVGNNGRHPGERVKWIKSDTDDQKRSPVF